jgi:hypothetical protein
MDLVILRWCKTKETGKLWSFEPGIWRSSTAAITRNAGDSSEMNRPKGGSFWLLQRLTHESTNSCCLHLLHQQGQMERPL